MSPFVARTFLESRVRPSRRRNPGMVLGFLILCLIAPVATAAAAAPFDGRWRGVMTCAGEDAGKAFQANRQVTIADGVLTFRKGRRGVNRFEIWRGKVETEGAVVIFGKYHWDAEKPLWFKGRINGRKLTATGRRGPKTCELVLLQGNSKTK